MSDRLHVSRNLRSSLPGTFDEFVADEGETLTRSVSSATTKILLGRTLLIRKRYVYSPRTVLKAAFRNTLLRPSRVEREFRMLSLFSDRLGNQAVPTPAAFGERRTLQLLRDSFLATLAVPLAVPLHTPPEGTVVPAAELGCFLAALHRAGLVHGSLFARNVLWVPGGGFRLLDLDHAQALVPDRLAPLGPRARDLAFLEESIPLPAESSGEALTAYAEATGEQIPELAAAVTRHRPEARARLARRKRVRPRERSAE